MSTYTPSPTRWRALAVLAAAQFLIIMDTSIIGVALPDMQQSLGFEPKDLSWVLNAYVIAFGGLLLVGGKLSDIFGAEPANALNTAQVQSHISGFLDGGVTPQPAGTHQEDPR